MNDEGHAREVWLDRAGGVGMCAWSPGDVGLLFGALLKAREGVILDTEATMLRKFGLLGLDGLLTSAGVEIAYHASEYQRQSEADSVARMVRVGNIGGTARLLDIGCGAGQTIRHLDRQGTRELTGIDRSAVAIHFARYLVRCGMTGGRFVVGDAHFLPFRDEIYSHVVLRYSLNYISPVKSLREVARVLEHGGILYARVEGLGFDFSRIKTLQSLSGTVYWCRNLWEGMLLNAGLVSREPPLRDRYRAFETAMGLRQRCKRAGLEVVDIRVVSWLLGCVRGFELVARRP